MLKLKLITPPAVEPVTLEDVKPQLRIDDTDTDFDAILSPLIVPAREWCEEYQNRAYITQTWELALDTWPSDCLNNRVWFGDRYAKLPRPNLQSIESITYTDQDGATTTWQATEYIVDNHAEPGQIVPINGWPKAKLAPVNGLLIRYVAGYGDTAEDVPQKIKQAIILLTIHWYENGMCDPPPAVLSLLSLDRVIPI